MSEKAAPQLSVNGWAVFAHPLFMNQLSTLLEKVETLKRKDPKEYKKKNATKRLAAICKLAFEIIPQDPTRADYRQGDSLGDDYKHWFRAKFFQQYRLFFRYSKTHKVIIYAWVNDEDTKRAYESSDDAYRVFGRMLKNGHPPDDWGKLLAECDATGRLTQIAADTKSINPKNRA